MKNSLRANTINYLQKHHEAILKYWQSGRGDLPNTSIEAHCDLVYTLVLLGMRDTISQEAVRAFAYALNKRNLPGFLPVSVEKAILVHNFAYALGAINLASHNKADDYNVVLDGRVTDLPSIIDLKTKRPLFPKKWAHHSWRVSHWIGGIPSIILSISQSESNRAPEFSAVFEMVRDAADSYVDVNTGLLRTYNSALVQAVFRRLYAARHDPDLGNLGGVAHLLWIDHAIDRSYIGLDALYQQSSRLFQKHAPFMEGTPYCLDFDIVQIIRTAGEQLGRQETANVARARQMMADIETFYDAELSAEYSLHRVPGALATWHECGLIADPDARYFDVIKAGYWL